MGEGRIDGRRRVAKNDASRTVASRGGADWLGLAATPAFAIMALAAFCDGGPADPVCSAAYGVSALRGMAPMYVLMSAFHSGPWVRFITARQWRPQEA